MSQGKLFHCAPADTRPLAVEPDYHKMFAVEVRGHDPSCRWMALEVIGDRDVPRAKAYFMMETCVANATYKSGPRKGQVNFSKRDKSKDRKEVVSFAEFDAFVARKKAEVSR